MDVEPAKSSKFKSLSVRMASGLALMAVSWLPVYYGGWVFAGLLFIFGARMVWEWVRMTDKKFTPLAVIIPIAGMIGSLALAAYGLWNWALVAMVGAGALAMIERLRRGKALWSGLGLVYMVLPCLALLWLRGDMIGFESSGFAKLMFVILVVIAADSFAYLGGSTIGGPKLAPKISPNKTWAGFLTGLLFAGVFGAIAAYVIGFSPWFGLILALPIAVFSVIGDLLESAIKRHLNVKDSGRLLPGHGGLLDRVDSLMLAAVIAVFALYIWPGLWLA